MSKRRTRTDDFLFISALAAVLVGIALLLFTTRALPGVIMAWPLLVIAAGGGLLYLALVRRRSLPFLFGGIVFVLEGLFFLASALLRLRPGRAWPLAMVVAGLAGIATGLVARRRPRPAFFVPSICFILMGAFFSLFSFGIVGVPFRRFIAAWWPSFLILGGIALFAAYGLHSRSGAGRAKQRRGPDRGP